MSVYRRAYLYLTCAVSVQAMAWAAIGLLRALLSGAPANAEALAFSAALAVVSTPLFIVHWRWVRQAVAEDDLERDAALRALYLYGVIALFLIPLLANAYDLVAVLISAVLDLDVPRVLATRLEVPAPETAPSALDLLWRSLSAVVVLSVAIAYHWRVLRFDRAARPATAQAAVIHRVFVFGFSLLGGALVAIASVQLLRWLLIQVEGTGLTTVAAAETAVREAARALVGLATWIAFWSRAQHLVELGDVAERRSALRKLYLYGIVFVGVVAAVVPSALILAGFLRDRMGLPVGGSLAGPLPLIPIAAVMWVYHTRVLRQDAASEDEVPRQAAIRRIYLYLVAAVGLVTLLAGLASLVQVVVGAMVGPGLNDSLREQLAVSAALTIVALPVWLLAWVHAQQSADSPGPAGELERRSTARRLYLYFFLFVATVTVLAGAIVVVYRLFGFVVGVASDPEIAQQTAAAAGYLVIGLLVWLYHGAVLRDDGREATDDLDTRLAQLRVAVVADGGGSVAKAVLNALGTELPALAVDAIEATTDADDLADRLGEADIIVTPSPVPAGHGGAAGELAAALEAAPGTKLLVPRPADGWESMGAERLTDAEYAANVTHAVRLIAQGKPVEPARPLGAAAMIGIAIGVIALLMVVVMPILGFVLGGGMRYLFGP